MGVMCRQTKVYCLDVAQKPEDVQGTFLALKFWCIGEVLTLKNYQVWGVF